MRPCHNCARLQKQCRVGDNSDNCVECFRLGRDCDLSFSASKWRRVRKERDRLFRELKEASEQAKVANAKAARLQKQFELVDEKEKAMLDREFENIAELEEEEQ